MKIQTPVRVLFVCLGNICRSPTAHGVFQAKVEQRGLGDWIQIDSCGTGDWHIGHPPDARATEEAARRGYDLSTLRARQVTENDFGDFDYIVAMDRQNLADLRAMSPQGCRAALSLMLSFDPKATVAEVPDPYYGGEQGFARVLDMVEAASEGLLQEIVSANPSS